MNHVADISSMQPLLLQLLQGRGQLDAKQLDTLRKAQTKDSGTLEQLLVKLELVDDRDIAVAYSEYLATPLFDPPDDLGELKKELSRLLPEKLCRDLMLVPVDFQDGTLDVAFITPDAMLIADELQLLTGWNIRPVIASTSVVERMLELLYKNTGGTAQFTAAPETFGEPNEPEHERQHENESGDDEILNLDQAPPPGQNGKIIRMVNQILEQALRGGASDIHLEPFEDECKIRLRIDGSLQELTPPSRSLFIPIVSRFKILAKMDIAEKRMPQDGAIALRTGEKRIDLRVNTVPTVYGEKMVMRILDKGAIPIELTGLGFDERQSKDLIESIQMPHGLMLVTGPTGSGKSTTLYACLNLLNEPDTNICTVEDPVEYKFNGMNQVQVKSQVGLTFASALRAFLRQDPDIIMVGEVRDQETAQICLKAALTGHFVLSTIHTNDALSAVSRLQDMGVEPFLLASTLRVLEAQRLIRRLCKECKQPYDIDAETAQRNGLQAGEKLFKPKGCNTCRGSGYKGRLGVFEVIRITPKMGNLIQGRASLPDLRQSARDQGMKLLADNALDKVRLGLTSLEEALTVCMAEE